MFPRYVLVVLLCFSTGLAASLIPSASAEELPTVSDTATAEEANVRSEQALADSPVEEGKTAADSGATQALEEDFDWGLNSIRGSFQSVNGYFDSLLELMGGRDGVCQYRCRYGM